MDEVYSSDESERKILKCPDCDKEFFKLNRLKEHSYIHTGIKPFRCHYEGCEGSFTRQYQLLRHIRSHTGEKPYICPREDCNMSFSCTNHLKRHLLHHDVPKPYKCDHEGCTESFTQKLKLLRHQCIHTGKKPYECTFEGCTESYNYPSQLKRHIDSFHKGSLSNICGFDGCHCKFRTHKELMDHVKTFHPPEFKCEVCNKLFKTKKILYDHHKTHQIHRKMHQCSECDKSFTKKSNLKVHINVVHKGEKPFTCKFEGCSKQFAYKHLLARHLKTHEDSNKNINIVENVDIADDVVEIKSFQPKRKRTKVIDDILGGDMTIMNNELLTNKDEKIEWMNLSKLPTQTEAI